MRMIFAALFFLNASTAPSFAKEATTEEILAKTRRVQQHPKSKAELSGVTLWCVDSLMVPILRDAIKMQEQAVDLLKANKTVEANQLLQAVEASKNAGRTLAQSLCRPQ